MHVAYASADFALFQPPPKEGQIQGTPGGCAWYRLISPAQAIRKHAPDRFSFVIGRDVRVEYRRDKHGETSMPTQRLNLVGFDQRPISAGDADIVVMQRWMAPHAAEIIRSARAAGQVIIQDVDDLFFEVSPSNNAYWENNPNPTKAIRKAVKRGKMSSKLGQARAELLIEKGLIDQQGKVISEHGNVKHYNRALRASDAIIVSTSYLAERYGKLGVPVYICHNTMDLVERWNEPRRIHAEKRAANPDHSLYIGWLGELGHRSDDWAHLRGVIAKWLDRNPKWKFLHIGARSRQLGEYLNIPSDRFVAAPQIALSNVPAALAPLSIGLVPLNHVPFNKAKSALKGMEYAAMGIPFIASATSEYQNFNTGIVVNNTESAWINALNQLADAQERETLAATALERVQKLDIDDYWRTWLATYEVILEDARQNQPVASV